MTKISPLAPKKNPKLPKVAGVKLATKSCGFKYKNRTDLLLALFDEGTSAAGVFTKSKTASSNIVWGKKAIKKGTAKALIVNAGNANAFNGKAGEESVTRIVNASSKLLNCKKHEIFPCATGVIGEPMDDSLITKSLEDLIKNTNDDNWLDAANSIRTTDTYAKLATRKAVIGGKEIVINGIAKGSGMIAPDMATMLSYIFTDAKIPANLLQEILNEGCDQSFNAITVDGDTSTSDTLLIFATGKAKHQDVKSEKDLKDFKEKLFSLMQELAHLIVKDGEGASKFITINVTSAFSDKEAKKIALSIANSPLVKTAIAGEDANWGRIVMAVGKSGQKAKRDKLSIKMGGVLLAQNGQLNPKYKEQQVVPHMKGSNILIDVDLGIGKGKSTIWTCDLTHEYISINADYRS